MTFKMTTNDMGQLRAWVRQGDMFNGKPNLNYEPARARLIELGDGGLDSPPSVLPLVTEAPQVSQPAPDTYDEPY